MASTLTLQQVVNWAQTFTRLIPIVGVAGNAEEPALSICNNVLQRILARPYNWKWNSVVAPPFLTDSSFNTQDYPHSIADLGWLESAVIIDPASTQQPQPTGIIETVRDLQRSSDLGNPEKLATMLPTDTGGIWRLWPVPIKSKVWQIIPTYQRKAPIKDGLSQSWSPIPDEMGYAIRQGFLAEAYKHADDPRADKEDLKFEAMIQTALGQNDMEGDSEGFFPDAGLFLG